MQLFQPKQTLPFMRYARATSFFSVIMIVIAIALVATRGLNFGLDFTGGTLLELGFSEPTQSGEVREWLQGEGYENVMVQSYGSESDLLVRVPVTAERSDAKLGQEMVEAIESASGRSVELRRIEFVGPNVGDELTEQGGLAMLVALICIMLYVSMRFEWRLAAGSVVALAHDVILTFGFFALTQMEFNLTTLAGILSVIGYSLNDTIVVFDRIRENFRKIRKADEIEVVNESLTQTLSRTIVTSLTTVVVLVALYVAGGELLKTFSAALLVGVGVGVYSSIYVATSFALKVGLTRESLLPVEVEKEGADQQPLV